MIWPRIELTASLIALGLTWMEAGTTATDIKTVRESLKSSWDSLASLDCEYELFTPDPLGNPVRNRPIVRIDFVHEKGARWAYRQSTEKPDGTILLTSD